METPKRPPSRLSFSRLDTVEREARTHAATLKADEAVFSSVPDFSATRQEVRDKETQIKVDSQAGQLARCVDLVRRMVQHSLDRNFDTDVRLHRQLTSTLSTYKRVGDLTNLCLLSFPAAVNAIQALQVELERHLSLRIDMSGLARQIQLLQVVHHQHDSITALQNSPRDFEIRMAAIRSDRARDAILELGFLQDTSNKMAM